MNKNLLILLLVIFACMKPLCASSKPFTKDKRQEELKYILNVLKDDEEYKRDKKILDLHPSGYMTVQEYEELSQYKDKSTETFERPKIEAPSDFMYIPKPLYSIVRYNDPPGSPELRLGKRIYNVRQINAQGVVSPDYTKLVYPAVYYYSDSASVACDVFVIPLDDEDTNLNKILKANAAKRISVPILSTDKLIDNYAAFRTITPVDFNTDGTKILLKEKIGSSEDGIWETIPYVYDFETKTDYDLTPVRDAIVYFWKEYMELDLDNNRWDIYPLGFDVKNPNNVIVQAFAFTGVKPVFLGTWSIDSKGTRSQLVTFDKDYIPEVSSNGYKAVKDGVEEYASVKIQEKMDKQQTEYLRKEKEKQEKETIKQINNEYKAAVRELTDNYKDDKRDLKKLRSMSGTTEGKDLQEAYEKYLQDQLNKDIQKLQKKIEKEQKKLDKTDNKLDSLYQSAGLSSKTNTGEQEEENSTSDEEDSNSNENETNSEVNAL